jgi:RNA ligase (TIGR02306 family)
MATLTVDVVTVESVTQHPNADRLEIIKLENLGYTVISGSGNLKVGDKAFYFPVDSVIPDRWVKEFGIEAYYSNKLRAAKLRGIFSEGLLISMQTMVTTPEIQAGPPPGWADNQNWTEFFGVTKYEYPVPATMSGDPEGRINEQQHMPSPEHLKKYTKVFADGEPVVVSEKLHGTNFTVHVDRDGVHHVGSHNLFWKLDSEANKSNIYMKSYRQYEKSFAALPPDTQLFGEVIGVQDLTYGLTKGKTELYIFGVRTKAGFMSLLQAKEYVEGLGLKFVPVLGVTLYDYEAIATNYNNLDSVLAPGQLMEGVVITPLVEREEMTSSHKRLALKLISDRYHLRKKGTELK